MNNIALILLGGKGSRLGSEIPKQFLLKDGLPIYLHTVKKYHDIMMITHILLVVNPIYVEDVRDEIKKYNFNKVIDVIPGGNKRYNSSYIGLEYLSYKFDKNDNVLIADAVRPNTSDIIILANIYALNDANAVLTAVIGNNSGERIDTAHIKAGVSLLAQTPQSFKLGYIYSLYKKYIFNDDFDVTDDIGVVELNNDPYDVVEGDEANYKITTKEDYLRYLEEKNQY